MTEARACAFCAIVQGKSPAHFVLQNDVCVAFLDARPLFVGHLLLVPRQHKTGLVELTPDEIAGLFKRVPALCRALERGLGADGSFVAVNDRVSQSVPHVHVHVVPRRRGDGLRGFFWPRRKYASDEEAAAIAARVREALA